MLSLSEGVKPLWLTLVESAALATVCVAVALSIAFNLVGWYQRNRIKLTVTDPDGKVSAKEEFSRRLLEHIDDLGGTEGEAVGVRAFWRKVRPRRYALLLLVVGGTALQGYRNYAVFTQDHTAWDLLNRIVESVAFAYLCLSTGCYVLSKTIERHSRLTTQLFLICSALTLHFYFATSGQYLAFTLSPHLTWADYSVLGFSLVTTIWVGLIPLKSGVYEDPTKLYNKAVCTAITSEQANDLSHHPEPDRGAHESNPNVVDDGSVSIISRLTAAWITKTITKTANVEQCDVQDLPVVRAEIRTQNLIRQVGGVGLGKSRWGPTVALLWAVWAPQIHYLLQDLALEFVLKPMWYVPHICLQNVLWSLDNASSKQSAYAWAALLVFSRVANLLVHITKMNITECYAGPRIRVHSSFLLYSKVLTRNTFVRPEDRVDGKEKVATTKADILNLISSDVNEVGEIGFTCSNLLTSQLEMVLGSLYIWYLLGVSGLYGLATLIMAFVPAYYITQLEYKLYEKRLEVKDEKISLMQEAIQAISMIKMMAAERFWFRRIKTVRDSEFKRMIQARTLGFISGLLYSAGPTLVVVTAFAHYTLVAKKSLTTEIAFTSIAVFDGKPWSLTTPSTLLRQWTCLTAHIVELRPILWNLPGYIAMLLQHILSAKRIGAFVRSRDVDYLEETLPSSLVSSSGEEQQPLHIIGTVAWNLSEPSPDSHTAGTTTPSFRLQGLNVHFPRGEMTLVAGKFGSGKTLLLLAMMGQARLVEGSISYAVSDLLDPGMEDRGDWSLLKKGVAYVSQTAWLQSLSIRENILFGLPMNEERYRAVLFAVGLLPDLDLLEDSDLTEIGERGKILSGGQKARVSLARAVYSRASTLLLDDVISAVDAETSQHIITHCFRSPLMAGRTVIIASHAVESLAPLAQNALFLDAGSVVWSGTGPELLESEHMTHLRTELPEVHVQPPTPTHREVAEPATQQRRASVDVSNGMGAETLAAAEFEVRKPIAKTPRQLIMEDKRAQGMIDLRHWKDLMGFNGGKLFWIGLTAILLASCLLPVAERKTLESWTHEAKQAEGGPRRVVFWVILYSCLSGASTLLGSTFAIYRFWGAVHATKAVHAQMLESLLRAKMAFFSKTRAGSIIQRFSKDLDDVLRCTESIGEVMQLVLTVSVSIVSVTVFGGGWIFAVITILLFVALHKPSQWYRSAGRQIRRLEAIIPGPINAIYSETVAGTAVIRAFGVQSVFISELLRTINMRTTAQMWRLYVARWLFINLRLMDVVIIFTALTLILTSHNMTGATAGFILAFASTITGQVNWLLIELRQIEVQGVSLERTADYRALELEEGEELNVNDQAVQEALHADMYKEYDGWPSKGEIKVEELSASYGPHLPDILHEVSFDIPGGQSVGIVGATGGGKSTLAKAFFSFVDITHGKIEIDGKDIANVPLGQVLSKLGIIAQDPILLSGTLRLNLDIEGRYSDDQLYEALHHVQLIERKTSPAPSEDGQVDGVVASSSTSISSATIVAEATSKGPASAMPSVSARMEENVNIFENLDYEIKSGGDNLSAGQKQLVVLARALLKRHRVLILDEATGSIDSFTDAAISRVVHEEFTGATVLIIAHRLRTIMPCDKILVMDKGRVVQQGAPLQLIKEPGGRFEALCRAAGGEEYRHLLMLAEKNAGKEAEEKLVDV